MNEQQALQKSGPNSPSRPITRERLTWLRNFLRLKNDRLQKIALFGHPSRGRWKAGCPRLSWEDDVKKDLREIGTSWEVINRKTLKRSGWRISERSCVGLRRLSNAVSRQQFFKNIQIASRARLIILQLSIRFPKKIKSLLYLRHPMILCYYPRNTTNQFS